MLELLQSSPTALLVTAGILGLLVGSFLNVVICRLPVMMERRWQADCAMLSASSDAAAPEPEPFNLIVPRSTCPGCDTQLSALDNIPLLSYLALRGKCRHCQKRISLQYPLVELLTAALSVIVVWRFGFGWQSLAALAFTWSLIALAVIDLKTQLLPDQITLPLTWAGLLANLVGLFVDYEASLLGAVAGYLSLWSLYHLFRLLTGKEGMGYGDFKLLAAIGAWAGWAALPVTIVLSSVTGAAIGVAMIVSRRHEQGQPIPFGPFLAVAGWIAFLWGDELIRFYLRFSGLNG